MSAPELHFCGKCGAPLAWKQDEGGVKRSVSSVCVCMRSSLGCAILHFLFNLFSSSVFFFFPSVVGKPAQRRNATTFGTTTQCRLWLLSLNSPPQMVAGASFGCAMYASIPS